MLERDTETVCCIEVVPIPKILSDDATTLMSACCPDGNFSPGGKEHRNRICKALEFVAKQAEYIGWTTGVVCGGDASTCTKATPLAAASAAGEMWKSIPCQSVYLEGLVAALKLSPDEQDQKLGSEVKRIVEAQQSTIEMKQLKREKLPQGVGINIYIHLMMEVLRDAAKAMEDVESITSHHSQHRIEDQKLWMFLSRGVLNHTASLCPLPCAHHHHRRGNDGGAVEEDEVAPPPGGGGNIRLIAYDTRRLRESIPYYVRNAMEFIQGATVVPFLYRDLGHAVKIPAVDTVRGLCNAAHHNSDRFHRLADMLCESLGCTVCNDRLQKLLLKMAKEVETWTW